MATKKKAVKKSAVKKSVKKVAKKTVPKKIKPALNEKQAVEKKRPQKTSMHIIPKSVGMRMIDAFLSTRTDLSNVLFYSGIEFDISLFEATLALPGVKKVRFHNAINEANEHTLVVTGVGKDDRDIYFKLNNTKSSNTKQSLMLGENDGVGDLGQQCSDPTYKK